VCIITKELGVWGSVSGIGGKGRRDVARVRKLLCVLLHRSLGFGGP
jgi:hypothetical protein